MRKYRYAFEYTNFLAKYLTFTAYFIHMENSNPLDGTIVQDCNITNSTEATQCAADGNAPTDQLLSEDEFNKLTDAEKIAILSEEVKELNHRAGWQEKIHRNVLPNGNVTHYYNIMPSIVIAAITGGAVALVVLKFVNEFKSKS